MKQRKFFIFLCFIFLFNISVQANFVRSFPVIHDTISRDGLKVWIYNFFHDKPNPQYNHVLVLRTGEVFRVKLLPSKPGTLAFKRWGFAKQYFVFDHEVYKIIHPDGKEVVYNFTPWIDRNYLKQSILLFVLSIIGVFFIVPILTPLMSLWAYFQIRERNRANITMGLTLDYITFWIGVVHLLLFLLLIFVSIIF